MDGKLVNYTALVGFHDEKRDDIVCYSEYSKFVKPVMNAKVYKILPHLFFDADVSVWTDANVKIVDVKAFVEEHLKGNDLVLFRHPYRKCIYEEVKSVISDDYLKRDIENQILEYRAQNYPENNGLYECGVIIRRHNKKVETFNNAWWAEICRWSSRDQISFPYVLSKFPDIKLGVIDGNMRDFQGIIWANHK